MKPRGIYLACTDSSEPIHAGIELNSSSKNGRFDLTPGIMLDQVPQRLWRFGLVRAVIHGLRIHVLTIAGISVVSVDIDSGGALARIESALREFSRGIRLTTVDHFGLRISTVHGFNKGSQKF